MSYETEFTEEIINRYVPKNRDFKNSLKEWFLCSIGKHEWDILQTTDIVDNLGEPNQSHCYYKIEMICKCCGTTKTKNTW